MAFSAMRTNNTSGNEISVQGAPPDSAKAAPVATDSPRAPSVTWLAVTPRVASRLASGPIERFFEQTAQGEFLRSRFDGEGELRLYFSAPLSSRSIDRLEHSLLRIAADFAEAQAGDHVLPLAERRNVGLLLAMRPWNLSAFERFRRSSRRDGSI
jgi:hypothetical protein